MNGVLILRRLPGGGGIFERLIGLTKRCLRKVIGRAKFIHDELLTAVTEIEAILNSRPLSYVSLEDIEEALTPSHLIIGRLLLNLPDEMCYRSSEEELSLEPTAVILNRRMKYLHSTIDQFWERWNANISNLRERYSNTKRKLLSKRIRVGDVVIIHNDGAPRAFWKLGRVKELFTSKDGVVRGGAVEVLSGGKRLSLLRRPIQCLTPLEVMDEDRVSPAASLPNREVERNSEEEPN